MAAAGNPPEEATLVSPDRRAVLIPIRLTGEPEDTVSALIEAVEAENGKGGFQVAMTGSATTDHDINELSERDLQNGELESGSRPRSSSSCSSSERSSRPRCRSSSRSSRSSWRSA